MRVGGRRGWVRRMAIAALLGLLYSQTVSSSGWTTTTIDITVFSTSTRTILLNGAYGTGSPKLQLIEDITAVTAHSGVDKDCALNHTVAAVPSTKFLLFDRNFDTDPWYAVSPCYWRHATDHAARMGAVAVVATLYEGANYSYNDVVTPAGPVDGAELAIPLVFVSRRDANVLGSFLSVFGTMNMTMSCPSCTPTSSGQNEDLNPWLYPLVFAGAVLVLLLAAITAMWATLRPQPPQVRVHPNEVRDREQRDVAAITMALTAARQGTMETALGRMSPSVPFSATGAHMESNSDGASVSDGASASDEGSASASAAPLVRLADQTTCAVCIDDFCEGAMVRALRCGHVFHSHCIDPWLLDRRTCPLCKAEILVEECGIPDFEDGDDGLHQLSNIFLDNALMAMEQLYMWQSQQPSERQDEARRSARASAQSIIEDYEALLESAENLTRLQERAEAQRRETWTPGLDDGSHGGATTTLTDPTLRTSTPELNALNETWTPAEAANWSSRDSPAALEAYDRGQLGDSDDGSEDPPAYSWA